MSASAKLVSVHNKGAPADLRETVILSVQPLHLALHLRLCVPSLRSQNLPLTFFNAVLEFKHASINGRNFLFGLISRRNRYRAGTRYFSRGIDQSGNVSNFNETEQIVLLDAQNGGGAAGASGGAVRGDIRFSYVQTRGSVPVYWAEINNLRYKPDLKILDLSSTVRPLSPPRASTLTVRASGRVTLSPL